NKPFYHSLADSLLKDSNQEIWNIFGNDQQIIFQSFSNIYSFDYQNIDLIIPPSNIMLGKSINNDLFVPKIEQGLYKIEGDQIVEIAAVAKLPERTKLADLCAGAQTAELILGTQYNGVFILKGEALIPINSKLNDRFKKEQINKLIRMSNGTYVVGTILNGVYLTDDFFSIKYHISKSNGLSNNTVLSLFEDKNKDLWVGLDKGINLIKTSESLTYLYDRQGKLGTIFTAITYNDALYLGTNQGVFKSNPDGFFTLIDASQGQNWSFIVIDGDLICGHNKGTFLIKNEEFIQISDITGAWCMEAIGDNRILQSTYTGLVVLEKKDEKWMAPDRVEGGDLLIENFVLHGQTLVGYHSYYGISVLKLSDYFDSVVTEHLLDKIDDFDLNIGEVHLFTSNQGISLALDTVIYKLDGELFEKMNTREFNAIVKEEHFAFQYQFYQAVKEISKAENLSIYQFFKPEETEKTFILGFDEGYLLVPFDYKNQILPLAPVNIDFLNVNGKTYKNSENLLFSSSQNDVSVQIKDFTFSSYNLQLKYNLENWDDQWYDIPTDGQLNFINLDDGNYALNIRDYNEKSFPLLKFTIKPYWYESWIGGLISTALLIFFVWYVDKRNKNKLRLQTLRLQLEKEKELESERMKAKNDKLGREIIYKSKMLANSTLTLVQKNKMLNELKAFVAKDGKEGINDPNFKQRIVNLINRNINHDEDWEIFERNFAEVHEDFLDKLKTKYPDITAGELKLAAYIRMNLSSKEIAPLLNISVRSVENKRYRLRCKMGIEHNDNLSDCLLRL
ncbi:MAG: AraC family chitin signaling transcriptional activator, partial [Saprospiraceae bacterium]